MQTDQFIPNNQVSRKTIFAIIGTGVMSFCGILLETAMNVTFPTLMHVFGVSISAVQWITSGYLLVASLVMTLASYMHKRFKLKQIFAWAVLLFFVGLFLCVSATNFSMLLIGRLISGVATGMTTPLLFGIISHDIPVQKLGRYMAIGAIIVSMASVGPTYGGIILYSLGWRAIFWIVLPLALIAAVIGLLNIQQTRPLQKPRLDIMGFFWLAGVFVLISLAFNEASIHGWNSSNFWAFLILGLLAGGLYVWHAHHFAFPLIDINIFKYHRFVLSFVAYALCQLINIGMSFLLTNFGQLVLGANSLLAGLLLLPGSLLRLVLMPFGGVVLDKHGAALPILTGISASLISGILFFSFQANLTIPLMTIFYALFSAGFSLTFSNLLTDGMKQLPSKLKSDGNAAFNAIQQYSGSIGASLMATFISISQMNAHGLSSVTATARGSRNDFILLIGMELIMLFLQLIDFRKQRKTAVMR
ncbi:MFS transporter [Pediococcus ethanolidurans]